MPSHETAGTEPHAHACGSGRGEARDCGLPPARKPVDDDWRRWCCSVDRRAACRLPVRRAVHGGRAISGKAASFINEHLHEAAEQAPAVGQAVLRRW